MDLPTVLVVTGVVPHFAQSPQSYMSLPTLPDAYLKFNIEISFKPEDKNGTSSPPQKKIQYSFEFPPPVIQID